MNGTSFSLLIGAAVFFWIARWFKKHTVQTGHALSNHVLGAILFYPLSVLSLWLSGANSPGLPSLYEPGMFKAAFAIPSEEVRTAREEGVTAGFNAGQEAGKKSAIRQRDQEWRDALRRLPSGGTPLRFDDWETCGPKLLHECFERVIWK